MNVVQRSSAGNTGNLCIVILGLLLAISC